MCHVNEGDSRIPELVSVSLVQVPCEPAANLLRVLSHVDDERPIYNITSCLGPIFNNYNQSNWLVEAMELDHLLGVDLSVFPIYSISPGLDSYMESLKDDGIITHFSWYHPILEDVYYFGQRVLLNDCLYRYMYKSQYIIVKDLDEIIVPSKHDNLIDMLKSLPESGVAEYNIRSVIYRDDLFSNYSGEANRTLLDLYQPKSLLRTRRNKGPFHYRQRSKYIIHPKRVLEVNIHFSVSYVEPYNQYEVPIDVALVHHHRLPVGKNESTNFEDRGMERYADTILNKIHQRHMKVHDKRVKQ